VLVREILLHPVDMRHVGCNVRSVCSSSDKGIIINLFEKAKDIHLFYQVDISKRLPSCLSVIHAFIVASIKFRKFLSGILKPCYSSNSRNIICNTIQSNFGRGVSGLRGTGI